MDYSLDKGMASRPDMNKLGVDTYLLPALPDVPSGGSRVFSNELTYWRRPGNGLQESLLSLDQYLSSIARIFYVRGETRGVVGAQKVVLRYSTITGPKCR